MFFYVFVISMLLNWNRLIFLWIRWVLCRARGFTVLSCFIVNGFPSGSTTGSRNQGVEFIQSRYHFQWEFILQWYVNTVALKISFLGFCSEDELHTPQPLALKNQAKQMIAVKFILWVLYHPYLNIRTVILLYHQIWWSKFSTYTYTCM